MKQKKSSVLNRTLMILGGYTLFLIATIPSGVSYISNNLKSINQSTIKLNELRLQVEEINDEFIEQAKHRKNLFLRGHDPEDLDKYRSRVDKKTESINQLTDDLLQNPLAKPYREDLEKFLADHEQLIATYYEGIDLFLETNDHTQGDSYVRGEGQDTGDELNEIIEAIQLRQNEAIVQNAEKIQQTLAVTTLLIILAVFVFSTLLTIGIIQPIRRVSKFSKFLEKNRESQNFGQFYKVDKADEIGYMVDRYNNLLSLIQDYNHNLEQKVLDRTSELAEANTEIQELNKRLEKENTRLSAELEITQQLQTMILPNANEIQQIPGLEIATFMDPADEVGGDYYDILRYGDQLKIGIGDVTGHGLESGVLMIMVQTAVRTLMIHGESNPVKFLDTVNRIIYDNIQRMDSAKNLTLSLMNYRDGSISLSGQHEDVILVRKSGEVELIDTIDLGFPIGLEYEIEHFISSREFNLNSGDGVVLFTDGVTEAENNSGEQYELDKLCNLLSNNWSKTSEEIKEIVISDVKSHIGSQKVFDDITFVILKQK
ncbi:PP2C family protein-serine/threonine phosphatase [[Leptolyngbya] sp. PCC 7376]|uniref:PP2C family protein-serine/threonine phosphatase n=1 Tax=[Leptolyngbya] sp. PCC 7376 TaxID=111781 RepID=UPI0002D2B32A|nr:PP2C family protein-serine/threonine phosphatase [[Leptolyngbya] sp. PCC 7376]